MTKEIRVLVSSVVTGQALSGTFVSNLWEQGQQLRIVVRLDKPLRVGDGVTDYLVVLNRDCQMVGHH